MSLSELFIKSNFDILEQLNITILPPIFSPIKSHTFIASKNLWDSLGAL